MSITIVSDAHIPFAEELISHMGRVRLISGHEISRDNLLDADALLVRSVTNVDAGLLKGTPVQFVGSATAGVDHIDTAWLESSGIRFANAPGGNAESVVEYVLASLFLLANRTGKSVLKSTVGIVGCGHVGSRLRDRLESLGISVLCNDPPLARLTEGSESVRRFHPLDSVLEQADILSLHVPFTVGGRDKTFGLIGRREIEVMRPGSWIINTARGGVVDESALSSNIKTGRVGAAVVDVWKDEPSFDTQLMDLVDIASPHVAGYSIDAKRNCTRIIADALRSHFKMQAHSENGEEESPFDLILPDISRSEAPDEFIHQLLAQMFDIAADDRRMRSLASVSLQARIEGFRKQRQQYPRRFSFSRFVLAAEGIEGQWLSELTNGLGIHVNVDRIQRAGA